MPDRILHFRLHGTSIAAERGAVDRPVSHPLTTEVRHAYRLDVSRTASSRVEIDARCGLDVVEVELDDALRLVLHPETAAELFAAGHATHDASASVDGVVAVPASLCWPDFDSEGMADASRGLLDGVNVKSIRVLAEKAIDFAVDKVVDLAVDKLADLALDQVTAPLTENAALLAGELLDGRVCAGLHRLRADAVLTCGTTTSVPLTDLPATATPLLLLIHGTFSSTQGSFGHLWREDGTATRTRLFDFYDGQIYAVEHATVTVSPLANALAIASALPANARVHLLTHSRGGLVAEALVRATLDDAISALETLPQAEADTVRALHRQLRSKNIVIERVVRVACPARGTLLASGRLDVYLSVASWLLEKAGLAPVSLVLDLLHKVARLRTDPAALPGLAAMTPDSGLIAWLHNSRLRTPGELRVVAGNSRGGLPFSWIKTLVADAFFWTDHDCVVQTRSMYGGVARADGASFLLADNRTVSHGAYFVDREIAPRLVELLTDRTPRLPAIGPQSAAGLASDGIRGAMAAAPAPASEPLTVERPVAVLISGPSATALEFEGRTVWGQRPLPADLALLARRDLVFSAHLEAGVFGGLVRYLGASHVVVDGSCDWRLPLDVQAQALAATLRPWLAACKQRGQPLRMLAHSTGGLVLRALAQCAPDVWSDLIGQANAWIVLLGVPQQGWWTPLALSAGIDPLSAGLQAYGMPGSGQAIRQALADCPGMLASQVPLDPDTWGALAGQDSNARARRYPWHHPPGTGTARALRQALQSGWGVPDQGLLARAQDVRQGLDLQCSADSDLFGGRARIVIGTGALTPVGYRMDAQGFALQGHDDGDGRVSRDSALWRDAPVWQVAAGHEELPALERAWPAYAELLATGGTQSIERAVPGLRPERLPAGPRRIPRAGGGGAIPPIRVLGPTLAADAPSQGEILQVVVRHGDLRFLREPLMLGHYRALRLTGTEFVIDQLIGGTLQAALALGRYPDQAGEAQVFINKRVAEDDVCQLPRPPGVIVIGLGPEGKLGPQDLVRSVRQGVIAWAQRQLEGKSPRGQGFELCAVLIGSGGSGVSAGQSAQLIVRGVLEANERLRGLAQSDPNPAGQGPARRTWPRVRRLVLTELYLDRAVEALRALRIAADVRSDPARFEVEQVVAVGQGGLERPRDSGYRGAQYDLISVVEAAGEGGHSAIHYTLDTRRARSEVKAQSTQLQLIDLLVHAGSNAVDDPSIGRTLFKLLVPVELEPYLTSGQELQIELTPKTAAIPWELLDAGDVAAGPMSKPWASRCKLLRQLRVENYRHNVVDADRNAGVLVIGEPYLGAGVDGTSRFPELPGARAEARTVVEIVRGARLEPALHVRGLIRGEGDAASGPSALEIVNALHERPWRVVHVAGHGMPPDAAGRSGGVVMSDDVFLGPDEIAALRVVPELVFVNCCHLGKLGPVPIPAESSYNRADFAASLASALIRIGVRCLVVAGWAVNDAAARIFAETLYDRLVNGRRFMDAVADAREETRQRGGNTWGAYQCYGDPDWVLTERRDEAHPPAQAYAAPNLVAASTLILELKALSKELALAGARSPAQDGLRKRLTTLVEGCDPDWAGQGAVAEAFAQALVAAGDRAGAIAWYTRALACEDGAASVRAAEQRINLQIREAWNGLAATATAADQKAARAAVRQGIDGLRSLIDLHPTVERWSLLGSAWKRAAMIAQRPPVQRRVVLAALSEMASAYAAAAKLARGLQQADWFYPAFNAVLADLRIDIEAGRTGDDRAARVRSDDPRWDEIREELLRVARHRPDFWSVVGVSELTLYRGLCSGTLATDQAAVLAAFADTHARAPAAHQWGSVRDQLQFVTAAMAAGPSCDAVKVILAVLEGYAGAGTHT